MWFSINFGKWRLGFLRLLHSFVHRPQTSLQRLRSRNMVFSLPSLSILKHLTFFSIVIIVPHFMLKLRVLFLQTKRTKKAGIVGKYGMYYCFDFTQISWCFMQLDCWFSLNFVASCLKSYLVLRIMFIGWCIFIMWRLLAKTLCFGMKIVMRT